MPGVAAAASVEEKALKKALFAAPTPNTANTTKLAAEQLEKKKLQYQECDIDTGITHKYLRTSCNSAVSSFYENWLPAFPNVANNPEVRVMVLLRLEVQTENYGYCGRGREGGPVTHVRF